MATLKDLADWLATAPEGTMLVWDSPEATDEDRRLCEETMEKIRRGELLGPGCPGRQLEGEAPSAGE